MIKIANKKELDELKVEGKYLKNKINNTTITLSVDKNYFDHIQSSERYINPKLSKSMRAISYKHKPNEIYVSMPLNVSIILLEIMDVIYSDNKISNVFKELQDLLVIITRMEYEEAFDTYIK